MKVNSVIIGWAGFFCSYCAARLRSGPLLWKMI
jgi:hypothetical protein